MRKAPPTKKVRTKKMAKTTDAVPAAETTGDFFFTVVRSLPGDKNDKPNAFLFASRTKPSDDVFRSIFEDKALRAMLPAGKPVMCLRYYKLPTTAPGFMPEWRIVLTTLSHYSLPLNDERDTVSMIWEEKRDAKDATTVHYKDLLTNCTELYRVDGCNGCPKKGLECVTQQFGKRPWPMTFSYNRTTAWDKGLTEGTTVTDRANSNKDHEFAGKDLATILENCAAMRPCGAVFRHPDETRPMEVPQHTYPLRAARAHRFFKDPNAVVTTEAAKAK